VTVPTFRSWRVRVLVPEESQDELLPWEHPDDVRPGEAAKWVRTYEELLTTVDALLASEEVLPRGLLDWADLERRRSNYLRRLEWWRGHLDA
jgi:hypothetical protein